MSNKKFDFGCIYYTNELIVQLYGEKFFEESIILPEKLRYIVLQLVQNNFDAFGKLGLSQEQMEKAIDHANVESYNATLKDMVKEGMVTYKGIDNDGEYVVQLTDAGKERDLKNQEMIKNAREILKIYDEGGAKP